MLDFRDMMPEDIRDVMPMVEEFYKSEAVDHEVEREILLKTAEDAADNNNHLIRGIVILDDNNAVGYAYITECYSCECGGVNIMIEEVFLKSCCRGRGYGKEFFKWLFKEYDGAKRFRLELTKVNTGAYRLYKSLGFKDINYLQMVFYP